MGIFEDIFGGSNTQSQSTSTPTNMNPFTTNLQGPLTNSVTGLLQNGVPQYQPGTGPNLAAPIGANEQTTLNSLQAATSPGGGTNNYLSDSVAGKYVNQNPFLAGATTAAQRTTMNNLNDTLGRSLVGQFLAAGQNVNPTSGSSAFDTSAGTYARNAAQTMGDIASNMGNNQYNTDRGLQQGAVTLQQGQVQGMINNLQAQALPRLIQQYGIDQGMALFQQQTTQLLQLLQTAGGIAQPVIGNVQQSTGQGSQEAGVVPDATNAFKAAFPKGV